MYPNHNTKFPSSTEQHITHTHTHTHTLSTSERFSVQWKPFAHYS